MLLAACGLCCFFGNGCLLLRWGFLLSWGFFFPLLELILLCFVKQRQLFCLLLYDKGWQLVVVADEYKAARKAERADAHRLGDLPGLIEEADVEGGLGEQRLGECERGDADD